MYVYECILCMCDLLSRWCSDSLEQSLVIVDLCSLVCFFFFQAEDGIRDLVRSRGLGDVYKRQGLISSKKNWFFVLKSDSMQYNLFDFLRSISDPRRGQGQRFSLEAVLGIIIMAILSGCLLYTSDAADERSSVDLGGRSIIKKKMK